MVDTEAEVPWQADARPQQVRAEKAAGPTPRGKVAVGGSPTYPLGTIDAPGGGRALADLPTHPDAGKLRTEAMKLLQSQQLSRSPQTVVEDSADVPELPAEPPAFASATTVPAPEGPADQDLRIKQADTQFGGTPESEQGSSHEPFMAGEEAWESPAAWTGELNDPAPNQRDMGLAETDPDKKLAVPPLSPAVEAEAHADTSPPPTEEPIEEEGSVPDIDREAAGWDSSGVELAEEGSVPDIDREAAGCDSSDEKSTDEDMVKAPKPMRGAVVGGVAPGYSPPEPTATPRIRLLHEIASESSTRSVPRLSFWKPGTGDVLGGLGIVAVGLLGGSIFMGNPAVTDVVFDAMGIAWLGFGVYKLASKERSG